MKCRILQLTHDLPLAEHLGQDMTIQNTEHMCWWPGQKQWIAAYCQGCAICQQTKVINHLRKTPLYKILVQVGAPPFMTVTMDLITQLLKSGSYDAIFTIIDHGCSWAMIFLPCTTKSTGEDVVTLYYQHMIPWFRVPRKLIMDWDPCFTSNFTCALCQQLGI